MAMAATSRRLGGLSPPEDELAPTDTAGVVAEAVVRVSEIAEAELIRMEADWEAGRLLMLKAAWMADNRIPNSMEASMSKAKAARVANRVTLRCVELCGGLGYSEDELLEKWRHLGKSPRYYLTSIMRKESGFDPHVHSYADARGLLQMIPATTRKVGEAVGIDDLCE